jgi:inner membrane protein
MPSIITHAVVGFAAGHMLTRQTARLKFWFFSILCPIIPDFDTLAFNFSISYSHLWGHRGFFHSLTFAAILAIIIVLLFFRNEKLFLQKRALLVLYFFLVTASHGILDAFTSGGSGVAFFAPFDNTRYFFPFRPILVSPLSISAFFSGWGARVLENEIIWIWVPSLGLMLLIKMIRLTLNKKRRRARYNGKTC